MSDGWSKGLHALEGPLDHSTKELDIKDPSDERSIYSMVPKFVKDAIDHVQDKTLGLTEKKLLKRLNDHNFDEHEIMMISMLRTSFWHEYHKSISMNLKSLNMAQVYGAVTTSKVFREIVKDQYALAFILTPPVDYEIGQRSLLEKISEWEYKIMNLEYVWKDPTTGQSHIDTKLIAEQRKIAEDVKNRVKGMVVTRVENKNLNVNVDTKAETRDVTPDEKPDGRSDQEIMEKFLEITGQGKTTIDVTTENIDDE